MKSRIKAMADSVSGESLLPGYQIAVFWLCAHMVEGVSEPSGVSFIRTPVPYMRVLLS